MIILLTLGFTAYIIIVKEKMVMQSIKETQNMIILIIISMPVVSRLLHLSISGRKY